ncbi:hypothetical protein GEMRC1_006504 [Eukaryota sp. GEM-RC1]
MRKFSAVLFCWPEGDLDLLTSKQSLALLPLGNIPLIDYHITLLERFGLQELVVVSPSDDFERLCVHLSNRDSFKISVQSADPDEGAVSVIKRLIDQDLIVHDVLVISLCTITTLPLHHLSDLFLINDAACVFLTHKPPSKPPLSSSYGVVTDVDSGKVLGIMNGKDLDVESGDPSEMNIPYGIMQRYKRINIDTKLNPAQMFIFSIRCLKHVFATHSSGTFWFNVIPQLILSSMTDNRNPGVYAYVQDDLFCTHLHSPRSVLSLAQGAISGSLNHIITPVSDDPPHHAVSRKSLWKGDVSVGEEVQVINSSIDEHVVIGHKVIIKGSAILSSVSIGDSTTITGSFIAPCTVIGKNVEIKNSVICASLKIADNVTITDTVYEEPTVMFDDVVFFDELGSN